MFNTTPPIKERFTTHNKDQTLRKYLYLGLIALWGVLGLHVFYLYVNSLGTSTGKGGTFVEATVSPISYLPYTSTNDDHKLFQNLLYEPCVEPVFSGANIGFTNKACQVTTSDYSSFAITVPPTYMRSDGEPLTIEDVFFTYNAILKDNVWGMPQLENYKNIAIVVDGSQLIVTFPSASIDNMIFFTNFILPQHILANREFEFYTETFATQPVTSACATLQTGENDTTSAVFDLTNCEESRLKFYQLKYFESVKGLNEYITNNKKNIDVIHEDLSLSGFYEVSHISNKFSTIFFNTNNKELTPTLRSLFAGLMQHSAQELTKDIVPDPFLFGERKDWEDISDELVDQLTDPNKDHNAADEEKEETISPLPASIELSAQSQTLTYSIQTPIINKQVMNMSFGDRFDAVSVSHNGGPIYFPQSFDEEVDTALYNLNPTLRNIFTGENTYTVRGYQNNEVADTFTITVHYIQAPDQPSNQITVPEIQQVLPDDQEANITGTILSGEVAPVPGKELVSNHTFTLIYAENTTNLHIIQAIKKQLNTLQMQDSIEFVGYSDSDTLDGKIESGEYDMILRTINMGLRKDISNLFLSNSSYINPSNYINEEMGLLVNSYFTSSEAKREQILADITSQYERSTPFVILGKIRETYLISDNVEEPPFPERLYVYGWRKNYIKNIAGFDHVEIDWAKVWKRENFTYFLRTLGKE